MFEHRSGQNKDNEIDPGFEHRSGQNKDNEIDPGFEHRSGQNKDNEIGIYVFFSLITLY